MAQVKLKAGKYMIPVTIDTEKDRWYFKFGFNKALIEEIKCFEGRKWHGFEDPPRKLWSAPITEGNIFRLEYLLGKKPYTPFEIPLIDYKSNRDLYDHQIKMVAHCLTRKRAVLACEMGTGKTLVAIEVMESVLGNISDTSKYAWYIGPKSGIKAVARELKKWDSKAYPSMYTYQGLVTSLKNWPPGLCAPKIVIIDESAKVKTPLAQRSQAVKYLAENMREEYGDDAYIILMSGAPAPKAPSDWWNQCEIAQPGFIREGNYQDFIKNLCLIEERESQTGSTFPYLITWWDDENKCSTCGQLKEDIHHEPFLVSLVKSGLYDLRDSISLDDLRKEAEKYDPLISFKNFDVNKVHQFSPSINEVARLKKRLEGLVLVFFKKDCLDLPEKRYERRYLKTTPEILKAAKLIVETTPRVVTARMLLRELSDGFQYYQKEVGRKTCGTCGGTGKYFTKVLEESGELIPINDQYIDAEIICPTCGGEKTEPIYKRDSTRISTPKDDLLLETLDSHEDIGRLIVWGSFQESIDRIVEICLKEKWFVLRVDARGFCGFSPDGDEINSDELLDAMDRSYKDSESLFKKYPKLCYVGHPKAGGNALTLTASPTMLYYSNDDDGDARMQSEDRFHRPGMDENCFPTIIDAIHLKTDEIILNAHERKKSLQELTMKDIKEVLEETEILNE